jgi:hypothetical protein
MLTFEFEEPEITRCECCGGEHSTLIRYIYQDGDAYAVYYARFSEAHRDHPVHGLVALEDWSEEAGPWDRVAFAIELWSDEDAYRVSVVDSAKSPWNHVTALGRILDREEALAHERLQEVFHISDHLTEDDGALRAYLERTV